MLAKSVGGGGASTYEIVTALPSSPFDGQAVILNITGRKMLMVYINAKWQPEHSYNSTIFYVDKVNGTDSAGKGTGTGSDAFATIQYAIDQIPGSVGGNVTIHISEGTYTENIVVEGKKFTGPFTITINGVIVLQETATSAAISAGAGHTQGTVTKAGAFTGDSYSNLLAYFVTDDEYRIIDSHTNDVLTLVGTAPSSTAQDVRIYDWGTIISNGSDAGITLSAQKGIITNNISFGSTGSWGISIASYSTLTSTNTEVTSGVIVATNSLMYPDKFVINQAGTWGFYATQLATVDASYTKVIGPTGESCRGISAGVCILRFGTILDGANYAFRMQSGSVGQTTNNSAKGYLKMRNATYGVRADTNSVVTQTANNQYVGVTTPESTDGSYAYID